MGIDVSKAWLDIAVQPGEDFSGEQIILELGIAKLVKRLAVRWPSCIVVEATGGYEAKLVTRLYEAHLPVARVNPGRVRRFAQGLNWLAKTDKIDAKLLANFGQRANPRLTRLPDEHEKRLGTLVKRRKQVLEMLVAERNHLENADPEVIKYIHNSIAMLKSQLEELDQAIQSLIEHTPDLKS